MTYSSNFILTTSTAMPIITFKTTDMNKTIHKNVINYTNPNFDDMQEIVNDVCCYKKAMNNYDMMKKKPNWFRIISYDILLNFIIPETNFNSLYLLKKVNKFFFNKLSQNRHYYYFLRNDLFLTERQKYIGENIFYIIANSSFSFEQFDNLYCDIKSVEVDIDDIWNIKHHLLMVAEKSRNVQKYINNDFKIFQLLKILSNKINREKQKLINCLLTYGLQYYMHFLFFKRHDEILDNNLIQSKNDTYTLEKMDWNITFDFPFFNNLIEIDWEYCHINIYNIFEVMHNNKLCYKTFYKEFYCDRNCMYEDSYKRIIMYSITEHNAHHIELTCKNIIDLFQIEGEFILPMKRRDLIKYIPWKYVFKYINTIPDNILINNISYSYMKEIYDKSCFIKNEMKRETKSFPEEFKTNVLKSCASIQKKLRNKI